MVQTRTIEVDTHWLGKKTPNGKLNINWKRTARQARKNLGAGGVVLVPNARPEGDPDGAEYRFEEAHSMARRHGAIPLEGGDGKEGDGRVFYHPKSDLYFVKAQIITTYFDDSKDLPVVVQIANVPYRENLKGGSSQEVLRDASNRDCIIGIDAPACINSLEKILRQRPAEFVDLLGFADFVTGFSGIKAAEGYLELFNERAEEIYDMNIQGEMFTNVFTEKTHKVGIAAKSGGHRTFGFPRNFIFGTSIGTSSTEMEFPEEISRQDEFMTCLRNGYRNSLGLSGLKRNTLYREAGLHWLSLNVADPIRKKLGTY
ncbi:MAG: hypothetical protein ABIH37_03990 [archaeon]